MNGTSAITGKSLSGIEHLRQSIRDIISTPLGSRVMRRDYGSELFRLVDAPLNRGTLLRLYAATAAAIARWEPRFRVSRVLAVNASPGVIVLDVFGEYLPNGEEITIDGIVVS